MNFLRNKLFLLTAAMLAILLVPKTAKAVVPPDFIFNIGSQIAQIFSVVVVFLSAIFVTSYQFIKTKLQTLRSRKLFWIFSIIFILIASLLGAAFYATHKQNALYTKWMEWFQRSGQKETLEGRHYFYDRIIVYGRDSKNQPILLSFEGSRQELKSHLFGHSYTVSLLYQGEVLDEDAIFNSSSSSIQAQKFVTAFFHTTTPELPTEKYELSFKIKNKNLTLSLSDLNGDFLVKNRLDYLRYVSAGKADIQIGNEKIEGKVMVDQVLSDNGAVPTLEGYDPKYVSHSIALWDEEGNFYHLDKSEAFSPEVPYASHTWFLYKEAGGATQKKYSATMSFKPDTRAPSWELRVPELNIDAMNFKLKNFLRGGKNNFVGFAEGEIVVGGKKKSIAGYALFEDVR